MRGYSWLLGWVSSLSVSGRSRAVFPPHLRTSNVSLSPSDTPSLATHSPAPPPPPILPCLLWTRGEGGASSSYPSSLQRPPPPPTHPPFTVNRRIALLILFFVIQASIMHKLVNLAVQRGVTWNPVERAVCGYISDDDCGNPNACPGDCPVSDTPSRMSVPHHRIITHSI